MTVPNTLPAHPSGVALQHYIDARLTDHRESHERQHEIEREMAREARDTLGTVMEAKFSSQNEWRASMSDLSATFMPRIGFETQHAALAEKLELRATSLSDRLELRAKQLSERVDAVEQQATKSAIVAGVISGMIGLLIGALVIPVVGHYIGL